MTPYKAKVLNHLNKSAAVREESLDKMHGFFLRQRRKNNRYPIILEDTKFCNLFNFDYTSN